VVGECCAMKFGWLKWVQSKKKWWIHEDCDNVHGFHPIFTMHMKTCFGIPRCTPMIQKIGQCHAAT
jgi:hypothetical protein